MSEPSTQVKKTHECGMTGRCYICGKTPTEFFQILQMPTIIPIFKQEISQNITETQNLYSNFVLRMQSLFADTENYKQEISYAQFQENRELYKKMMPRGEELMSFCPDDEDQVSMGKHVKSHDACSMKDMRANIQNQLDKLSQGTITKFLRKHNPILTQKLEQYYSDAKSDSTVTADAIHFFPYTYDYLCDQSGNIVILYKRPEGSSYYSIHSFDEQGKIIEGAQPVSSVLQIRFKYEMCPICNSHFCKG